MDPDDDAAVANQWNLFLSMRTTVLVNVHRYRAELISLISVA